MVCVVWVVGDGLDSRVLIDTWSRSDASNSHVSYVVANDCYSKMSDSKFK